MTTPLNKLGQTVSTVSHEGRKMDVQQLVERLQTVAPSCLSSFNTVPATLPEPFDDNPTSVWQLACQCGGCRARFLGYSLADLNPEYHGPECLVSPLALECTACNAVTELLDTDRHGYHAEVSRLEGGCGSAKIRGDGARKAFGCPACGANVFEVEVGFVFWHPDDLAEEFDGAWEELFSVFLCRCRCVDCGDTSEPTDFGKL